MQETQSIYDPGFLAYGGGATSTVLHPIVAVAMCIAIVCLLILPRKYALAAFLVVVLLLSSGQQIYISGVHLFVARILIVAGLLRAAWSKLTANAELFPGGITVIDKTFLCWAVFRAAAGVLVNGGASGAIVYQSGFIWDAIGGYFLLRFLISDEAIVTFAVKTLAGIVFVISMTMLYEKFHDINIFGYLGSGSIHPDIREGAIRARGPLAHAILAGVFGAVLLPLFLWLWHSGKSRLFAVAGFIGSTIMVLTAASSTSLLTYAAVFIGCSFWVMRKYMRLFRWGIVIALVGLQLVMKAPVWFVISHVDIVAGNSSFHRAMLIDEFIRHMGNWWLVGTNDAKNWGWDMWDTSNQFVAEGESGGLLTFLCFVLMISWSFGLVAKARKAVEGDRKREWFYWFLGVAMFANVVGYFGISYFDQTKFMWYAFLCIISVSTSAVLRAKPAEEAPAAAELLHSPPAPVPAYTSRIRRGTSPANPHPRPRPLKPGPALSRKFEKT